MKSHHITLNGVSFVARHGELLLDAALSNGLDLPYDCRSGHCGTCCVRLLSGTVQGGAGAEPHVFHACQCRVSGNAVLEKRPEPSVRAVGGVIGTLRPLSKDVMEVGILTDGALPFHAGQYAHLQFDGFPSRPFSMTHPLDGNAERLSVWFHIRRMAGGRVTAQLGARIKRGHRVTVSGPFGSAYFRPNVSSRLILVATNTGFAPIWSIAAAALRENPERRIMIIVGGRDMDALYMGPALARLASFPNVLVLPVCSTPQTLTNVVRFGRPPDYLPQLLASDVIYACGAPGMVDTIKAAAGRSGVVCYADPFLAVTNDIGASPWPPRTWLQSLGGLVTSVSRPSAQRSRNNSSPRPQPASV